MKMNTNMAWLKRKAEQEDGSIVSVGGLVNSLEEREMRLPIYLDYEVQRYLTERAAHQGIPLGEMVNGLLKREIQIIESAK